MSEEPEAKTIDISEEVPLPPPRRKTKAKRRPYRRAIEHDREIIQQAKPLPAVNQIGIPLEVRQAGILTLADIQAAKAVLAQAEAALGIAQPKKEVLVATHPQNLEDPALGDKTPAVVEWYRDNDPEQFKRRYAGRKTHLGDRRKERPYEPLPAGATPATFPADPDGKFMVGGREVDLSKTDDSGRSPRNTADI